MAEALSYKNRYTREEYLTMEAAADSRSEFIDGEIFAMADGSRNLSVICVNLMWCLREAVDSKDCVAFDGNMKLEIPAANAFVYPDAMVVCGDIEFSEGKNDILRNPLLIIEVLSPATQAFDRGKKFKFYRGLDSVQEYVMISQEEPLVEAYSRRDPKTWPYTVAKGLEDGIEFASLAHHIDLEDIYRKVVFTEANSSQRTS